MDLYGIGPAVEAVAEVYFSAARRTGRTENLLKSLKSGDRIVTVDDLQARLLRAKLREMQLNVQVLVMSTSHFPGVGIEKSEGRTILDHTWVEQFYRETIRYTGVELTRLEKHLSSPESFPVKPAALHYPTYKG